MKSHEQLDKWINDNFWTNAEAAEKLSVKGFEACGESVRVWRSGEQKPRLRSRPIIEAITRGKVKAKGW